MLKVLTTIAVVLLSAAGLFAAERAVAPATVAQSAAAGLSVSIKPDLAAEFEKQPESVRKIATGRRSPVPLPAGPVKARQTVAEKSDTAPRLPPAKQEPLISPEDRFKAKMAAKESEIAKMKGSLAEKETEAVKLRAQAADFEARLTRGDDGQFKKLVSTIKTSSTSDAAMLLAELDKPVAVEVLGRLDQRTLAKLLPAIDKRILRSYLKEASRLKSKKELSIRQ